MEIEDEDIKQKKLCWFFSLYFSAVMINFSFNV